MTIYSYPRFAPRLSVPAAGSSSVTNANNTGADETVLASNPDRLRVLISNLSLVNVLYVNFGAAAGAGAGFILPAMGWWDSGAGPVPYDAIHVLGTAGQPRTVISL